MVLRQAAGVGKVGSGILRPLPEEEGHVSKYVTGSLHIRYRDGYY